MEFSMGGTSSLPAQMGIALILGSITGLVVQQTSLFEPD